MYFSNIQTESQSQPQCIYSCSFTINENRLNEARGSGDFTINENRLNEAGAVGMRGRADATLGDMCLMTSHPLAARASLGCNPARWSPTAFRPWEEREVQPQTGLFPLTL